MTLNSYSIFYENKKDSNLQEGLLSFGVFRCFLITACKAKRL